MLINITVESGGRSQNIRIDNGQKIGEGLSVLRKSGKLSGFSKPDYFHSQLNEKLVSAYKTFAEEQIFDGDILTSIE